MDEKQARPVHCVDMKGSVDDFHGKGILGHRAWHSLSPRR